MMSKMIVRFGVTLWLVLGIAACGAHASNQSINSTLHWRQGYTETSTSTSLDVSGPDQTISQLNDTIPGPSREVGLSLSGGGYRAMLYHLGAILRLNELGYLRKISAVASVSSGSIVSATLALGWSKLKFDEFGVAKNIEDVLIDPIRNLARNSIDVPSILLGMLTPWSSAEYLTSFYEDELFGAATLQDFPNSPRFILLATELAHGTSWRFSKLFMGDYFVAVRNPTLEVAKAVAASSAFPPFLSPLELLLDPSEIFIPQGGSEDLKASKGPIRIILTDGGVVDNRGIPTLMPRYPTLLISDGGAGIVRGEELSTDWISQVRRVVDIVGYSYDTTSRRAIVSSFLSGNRRGTMWTIRSNIEDFGIAPMVQCPVEKTTRLASIPTRLSPIDDHTQEMLINWGYISADAAMRRYVEVSATIPTKMPYGASPCE